MIWTCSKLCSLYTGVSEKQRNDLAHGLFGFSNAIPDAVLWSDIQDHANFLINVYLQEYKGVPFADPHERLRNTMFVYTRQDLETLLADLKDLQYAAFCFHAHHQPRAKTYNYLNDILAMKQIKEALKIVRRKAQGDAQQMSDGAGI